MTRIRATFNGKDVTSAEPKDMSIDSKYVIPKMKNELYGTYVYTFSSNPTNTAAFQMFTIDFSDHFDYMPMGFMIIEETTDKPDDFGYLQGYSLLACTTFDGAFRISTTYQGIYGVIERDTLRYGVYYYHDHETQAGFSGTPCPQKNVNGKTYTFKYYIFVEGDEDKEIVDITTSI